MKNNSVLVNQVRETNDSPILLTNIIENNDKPTDSKS